MNWIPSLITFTEVYPSIAVFISSPVPGPDPALSITYYYVANLLFSNELSYKYIGPYIVPPTESNLL